MALSVQSDEEWLAVQKLLHDMRKPPPPFDPATCSDESALWAEYMRSERHSPNYKETCPCYYCRMVRDGFSIWKAKRIERTQQNDQSSPTARQAVTEAQRKR